MADKGSITKPRGTVKVIEDNCFDEKESPAILTHTGEEAALQQGEDPGGPACNDDVDVSRIVEKCERPPAPPSNEECNFSRGRCVLHQIRGVRYHQTTRTWKYRGGGRGFGRITRRTVR